MHSLLNIEKLGKLYCFADRIAFFQERGETVLLQLAYNKLVWLFIQMYCESERIEDGGERETFRAELKKYEPQILQQKSLAHGKARAELFLYQHCPAALKKIYAFWHCVKRK